MNKMEVRFNTAFPPTSLCNVIYIDIDIIFILICLSLGSY